MPMNNFKYQGSELEVFKFAKNWKNYYKSLLVGHLSNDSIIEIGSGIGEMTKCLRPLSASSVWICVEPDKSNSSVIKKLIFNEELDANIEVFTGTLEDFDSKDVKFTCADPNYLTELINLKPEIKLEFGLKTTINWAQTISVRDQLEKWIKSVV